MAGATLRDRSDLPGPADELFHLDGAAPPARPDSDQSGAAGHGPRRLAIGESALVPWLERQLAARDWRQADLARGLGISTGMVSNWLTGQRRVSPYYCERIAALFGADVDYLLALAGHRPMVLSTDPDDPVEQLVTKLRRIRLTEDRFDTLSDVLDGMLTRDRRDERGRQMALPVAFGGIVANDGE
jgi:transcriptional regulator with XRE-family HTH domain